MAANRVIDREIDARNRGRAPRARDGAVAVQTAYAGALVALPSS